MGNTVITTVRLGREFDDFHKGLQYIDGIWQGINQETLRIYEVHERKHWFRSSTWSVKVFAGADTAAIGGGTVWYDDVSEDFTTEREAILELEELLSPLVKEAAHEK